MKNQVITIFDAKIKVQKIRQSSKFKGGYIVPNLTGHIFLKQGTQTTGTNGKPVFVVPYVFFNGKWLEDSMYFTPEKMTELLQEIA